MDEKPANRISAVERLAQLEAIEQPLAVVEAGQGGDFGMPEYAELKHLRRVQAFNDKIQRRKERLQGRAANAQSEGQFAYKRARSMASVIPFGQPILVGHHSERRDRAYRGRIHDTFGKAFKLQEKAEYLQRKAETVGTGGISSDDPEAITKLKAELSGMEASQEMMKAANKIIRKHADHATRLSALQAVGFSPANAERCLTKDVMGSIGYPSYALSNNTANMRRVKQRIADLEARSKRATVVDKYSTFEYREDTEENRVMFIFDGKPSAQIRDILKAHAFKWSPSRDGQPWVRQMTAAGRYAGKQVLDALLALEQS